MSAFNNFEDKMITCILQFYFIAQYLETTFIWCFCLHAFLFITEVTINRLKEKLREYEDKMEDRVQVF